MFKGLDTSGLRKTEKTKMYQDQSVYPTAMVLIEDALGILSREKLCGSHLTARMRAFSYSHPR